MSRAGLTARILDLHLTRRGVIYSIDTVLGTGLTSNPGEVSLHYEGSEETTTSGEMRLESEVTSTPGEVRFESVVTSTSGDVGHESEVTSTPGESGLRPSTAVEAGVSSSSGDVRPGSGVGSSSAYLVMLIFLGLYGLKTIPVIRYII